MSEIVIDLEKDHLWILMEGFLWGLVGQILIFIVVHSKKVVLNHEMKHAKEAISAGFDALVVIPDGKKKEEYEWRDGVRVYHVSLDRYKNVLKKSKDVKAFCSSRSNFPKYNRKITGAGMFYSERVSIFISFIYAVITIPLTFSLVHYKMIQPFHSYCAVISVIWVFAFSIINLLVPSPWSIKKFEKEADKAIQTGTKVIGVLTDSTKYFCYKRWQKTLEKYKDHQEIFRSFEETEELLKDIPEKEA